MNDLQEFAARDCALWNHGGCFVIQPFWQGKSLAQHGRRIRADRKCPVYCAAFNPKEAAERRARKGARNG